MARSLRIVNESKRKSTADYERVDAIEHAVRVQLRDLADAWGQYVWQVVDDANRTGFKTALLEDADDASALGSHAVGPDALPYARVSSGRSWTTAGRGSSARTPSRPRSRTKPAR